MPNIIAKLLLAMVTLVAAPVMFFGVSVAFGPRRIFDELDVLIMIAIPLVVFAFIGTYLWRKDVHWTVSRVSWTAVSLIISAGITLGVELAVLPMAFPASVDLLLICIASLSYPLWITMCIYIWRETKAERGARISKLSGKGSSVPCPTCGYDMTGLKEAKCPECGAAYTLDQLYLAWRPEHAALAGDVE